MQRPAPLSLKMPHESATVSSALTSPSEAGSGLSSPESSTARAKPPAPSSRVHKSTASVPFGSLPIRPAPPLDPGSPGITSLPPFPSSPLESPKQARSSRNLFSNLKTKKSAHKIQPVEGSFRHVSADTQHEDNVLPSPMYSLNQNAGSTPDLSSLTLDVSSNEERPGRSMQRKDMQVFSSSVGSDSVLPPSSAGAETARKSKNRFRFMKRTHSIRIDADGKNAKPNTFPSSTSLVNPRDADVTKDGTPSRHEADPPQTAPLRPDRPTNDLVIPVLRDRSIDRPTSNQSNEVRHTPHPLHQVYNESSALSASSSGLFKQGTGSRLFGNIKGASRSVAKGFQKVGTAVAQGMERRPSSHGREDEPPYEPKVLCLPLAEQTRLTRIAHRLEDSKDKTEFWMPALPWRCIDYLNQYGCESEGIYRIAGSTNDIRRWAKRFDLEKDIDLFNEPGFIDINSIASLLKEWFRVHLPEPILPEEIQNKILDEKPDPETVPQTLKDALSELPPWNYYLLFAMTCHLSLLTAYADKNKMTYGNLQVVLKPTLHLHPPMFNYLVQQWRDCWQGCYTEKRYLEQEYALIDNEAQRERRGSVSSEEGSANDRNKGPSRRGQKKAVPVKASKPPPIVVQRTAQEPMATPKASRVPELAPVKRHSPIDAHFRRA